MQPGATLPALIVALVLGPAGDRAPAANPDHPPVVSDFPSLRQIALSYLGRPYRSGGVGNPGFDCSGYVGRVFREAGYRLPRVSRDQVRAGRPVSIPDLAPGDLVFFSKQPGGKRINHVAIYLGGGEIVHAETGHGRVLISELRSRYYAQRLVAARRLLPEPGLAANEPSAPGWAVPEIASLETSEHTGESALPPLLDLPPRPVGPVFGPELPAFDETSLALRAAGVTERGRFGFVLAPEGTLRLASIALELVIAAPIRFESGRSPTVGRFETAGDYLRFLRSFSLGLRGADLELRLARLGDSHLGNGMIVDHLQPASGVEGIAGLAVETTPLSLFVGVRDSKLELEGLIDDVALPGVIGLGARIPLLPGWLRGGAAVATDQRAATLEGGRRAITAAEASLLLDLVDDPTWGVGLEVLGGLLRSSGDTGLGGTAAVSLEYRFEAGGASAIGVRGEAAVLGGGFVEGLFGATYAGSRNAHFEALSVGQGRGAAGGELTLRLDKLLVAGGHQLAIGHDRLPFDERTFLLVEVHDLGLFGTRALDLRLSYAARGLFGAEPDHRVDTLHGSMRLRLAPWLFAEAYLADSERLEGGGGLSAAWIP